jgi:hypothetical protein
VEHNFLGLDDRTFIAPAEFRSLAVRNRDIHTVKLGVNYRFNWGSYQYRLVFPPVVCLRTGRMQCQVIRKIVVDMLRAVRSWLRRLTHLSRRAYCETLPSSG